MNFWPRVTGRSLEYKLNRISARTEPWGRPLRQWTTINLPSVIALLTGDSHHHTTLADWRCGEQSRPLQFVSLSFRSAAPKTVVFMTSLKITDLCFCLKRGCPLLFSIYTSPIHTNAQSHLVTQQQYVDDTQLYISFSPSELSGQINARQSCLASHNSWFCENGLALHPTKSDAIVFGTYHRLKFLTNVKYFKVAGTEISLAEHIEILYTIWELSVSAVSITLPLFCLAANWRIVHDSNGCRTLLPA